jgi:hypothetical protein
VIRSLQLALGVGRIAFGIGLMTVPRPMAGLLMGTAAEQTGARFAARSYGTRDLILGGGLVYAALGGSDVRPWLAAGIAADAMDAGLQLLEWDELVPGRRAAGVTAASTVTAAGIALLSRS